MSPEETNLRYRYRQWMYRFQTPTSISIGSLATEKEQYWRKFGWEAHNQLIREVEIEVFHEMQQSEVQRRSQRVSYHVPSLRSIVARKKSRWTAKQKRQGHK